VIKTDAVTDLLAHSALFGVMTEQERAFLAKQMGNVVLDPGQVLFSRGDPGKEIYLVIEGRLRLSVLSPDGRELSFAHAVAGDLFGEIAALDGAPRSADATAITRARLKTLSQSALHKLMTSNSTLALASIKLLCTRLRDVSEHFEAIALHPVEVRLARLLLDKLEREALSASGETAGLRLEITQSELGLLIGTTRQRANAALTSLEKAGAISRCENLLQCSLPELQRIAQRS
jgi:CRP/FNR family transcriptional regulator, cyclic AMP receptor protein